MLNDDEMQDDEKFSNYDFLGVSCGHNVDTWPAAAATVTETWDVMDQLMDNVCVNC